MNLFKVALKDIVVTHLENDKSCFHIVSLISDSKYLEKSILYVSEKRELYGVSYSLYKSMISHGIGEAYVVRVPGKYDECYDFYLYNIPSNMTLLYSNIKEKYPSKDKLMDSTFDGNQIDLMYSTKLEQKLDEVEVEKEILDVKRVYKITILLKTLEDNKKIQKYFQISRNLTHNKEGQKQKELIIDYDYFKRIALDKKEPPKVNRLFGEEVPDDTLTPFPSLIIDCKDIEEMNKVLDFFKINKDKIKTTRINFKKIEKYFK